MDPKPSSSSNPKNPVLIILLLLIIGLSIGLYITFSKHDNGAKKRAATATPLVIDTLTLVPNTITPTYSIQGKVIASNQVILTAEVSGPLLPTRFQFKPGQVFSKGDILVHIDDSQAKLKVLQLKSAFLQSLGQLIADYTVDYPNRLPKWTVFLANFSINRPLPPLPASISNEEQFYLAAKGILSQFYAIQDQELQLAKYTLTAPFDGSITQGSLSTGQAVLPGTQLGTIMQADEFDAQLNVGISMLKWIYPGQTVTITSPTLGISTNAVVYSINNQIDSLTQTGLVLARFTSPSFKSDSYVQAEFKLKPLQNAVTIPRELVINRHVYSVTENTITPIPIEVLYETDSNLVIRGITGPTTIATTSLGRLTAGRTVQPSSSQERP